MPLGVCMTTCCQWQAVHGALRVAAAPCVPFHATSASLPAKLGWPPMATTNSAPHTAAHNAKQCLQPRRTALPADASWPSRQCSTLTSATDDRPSGGPQHTPALTWAQGFHEAQVTIPCVCTLMTMFSLRQVMDHRTAQTHDVEPHRRLRPCKPVHTQTNHAIQICPSHEWPKAACPATPTCASGERSRIKKPPGGQYNS